MSGPDESVPTSEDDRRAASFLTPRRGAGLVGASLVATLAYGLVSGFTPLGGAIFLVVFAVVFTALNYALWRYD